MAETDTSIYKLAQPTDQNPFAMVGQAANALNAVNQNKLFQASFAARQAIGDAYAKATDPNTGALDTNKLMGLVSQDPRAAFMAGDVAQQSLARESGQLDVAQKKMGQIQALMGATGPLAMKVRNGEHVERGDFIDAAMPLINSGAISPQVAAGFLAKLPSDQGQLDQLATSLHLRTMSAAEQHAAIYGSPQAIGTGGQTNIVQVPTMGGAPRVAGVLPNTLSPGEASTPTPIFDPTTNTFRDVTRNQFVKMAGQGGAAPPPAAPGGLSAVAAPNAAPAATGVPAAPAQAPGVQSRPALGEGEAASAAGTASGSQLGTARSDVANANVRIFQLQKALQAVQGTNTGPGTEARNTIGSFFNAALPETISKILPGVDPEKIKNYDEANKYLVQYAESQAAGVGPHTNEGLATALSGNASTHISNLAAQDVIRANIGIERMKQAMVSAFEQSGQPESGYGKFATQWAKSTDPRVFVADQLDGPKFREMVDKMKPPEREQFRNQYNTAVHHGWING